MRVLRWFGRNLGTMLLSFVLALIVWSSAVTSADPNEERTFQVPVEVIGRDSNMEIIGSLPDQVTITLYAPRSILDDLAENNNALRAWVDLSGLSSGTYVIPIQYQIPQDVRPLRLVGYTPKTFEITLEALVSKTFPIQTEISGEPALGYQKGDVKWSHEEVVVSGRQSLVERVDRVEVRLNIAGAREDIQRALPLIPRDAEGNRVVDITLNPTQVVVTQTITLKGGYRNMVVKVVTLGQVAEGYRQTSISVSPPNVMIFSPDPTLVDSLPGYIETEPLDLTGAADDIETVLPLNLPEGVSVIGDPNVLVQVGVAAIEGSINISKFVEVIGILPDLVATVSPGSVEVILYGPIPTLEEMTDVDVRVVVDLTGLEPGVYQLQPEVIIIPDRIRLQVISPETVEVEITVAEVNTPTPTLTPAP